MNLEECPATLELNYDGHLCYAYHINCAVCGEPEESLYCNGTEDSAAAEFREDGWHLTYNNSQIFHKALGCGFRDLDGKGARDVTLLLHRAIADILQHRPDYEPLEPDNGWGGLDDVLDVLRGLRSACEEYPDGIIRVF